MTGDALRDGSLQDGGATRVLAGIPALGWGRMRECTFAGALESALAVTDHPCDYATIMGATGLAFRARWWRAHEGAGWCPSSPVGESEEEIEHAGRASGWRLRRETRHDESGELCTGMDDCAQQIVESIDAGRPVLAYYPDLNMSVVGGYSDGGKSLIIHSYAAPDGPSTCTPSDLRGLLVFPEGYSGSMSPEGVFRQGLQAAVDNWDRVDPVNSGRGSSFYGWRALEKWSSDIAAHDTWSADDRAVLFSASWRCFDCLVDARIAAVSFLRTYSSLAEEFSADSMIERAASIYQREVDDVLRPAFRSGEVFLGPWTGKSVADWGGASRDREQSILYTARFLETEAMLEIRSALSRILSSV